MKKFCVPIVLLPAGHIVPVTTQIQGNNVHCNCWPTEKLAASLRN